MAPSPNSSQAQHGRTHRAQPLQKSVNKSAAQLSMVVACKEMRCSIVLLARFVRTMLDLVWQVCFLLTKATITEVYDTFSGRTPIFSLASYGIVSEQTHLSGRNCGSVPEARLPSPLVLPLLVANHQKLAGQRRHLDLSRMRLPQQLSRWMIGQARKWLAN